jgi:FkbM family methyltransferase
MEKLKPTIETVQIHQQAFISGYTGEYVFERIRSTANFYEIELLNRWIENSDHINVIYDIGANIGNHTLYFASNTNARIYAFEPMQMNFHLLNKNIHDNEMENRITAYNVALGDQEGMAQMGLVQENNNGTAAIFTSENSEGEPVKVIVLDNMDIPLPDFIKIDVEGFELNVLKGMKNILSLTKAPLWIEVDEKNAKSVYEFLVEIGYFVSDFVLASSNNILFTKKEENKIPNAAIFEHLMIEAASRRKNWIDIGKQISKYQYERNKAEDFKRNLQEITSEYEQVSKESQKLEEELINAKKQYQNNLKQIEDLSSQVKTIQKDLYMFQNSKMIKFMRFWVWKVPTQFRRLVKKELYKVGNWFYVRLLPYPRLRLLCSKINGKLRIFKDPQAVVTLNKKENHSENKLNDLQKAPKQMNVAMIVDEFTYNSFRFECNALALEPHNWKDVFEKNEIDFFFCESAWSGVDSLRRPWKGKIYCSTNFSKENRQTLLQILEYCHKKNIPTAFWNKEDPTHYPDKVHNFVDTALKFDHIFTTSKECVERYKKDYGHKSVHLLMFASQPKLFNPIEKFDRTEEIIFAGSWYNQHKDRCVEMESILDTILHSPYPLKVYNRQSGNTDPNHAFPSKYEPFINAQLSHDQLDVAYKGSKYALNINTVTDSDTMFARRVFELMSSNTLVISNYSRGMELLFGDDVVFIKERGDLNLSGANEKREKCLYEVLQHHTYKKRFKQILGDIDVPFLDTPVCVTIIYDVADFKTAANSINHFYKINWDIKACILLVNENCSPDILQELCIQYNNGRVSVFSKHYFSHYDDLQLPKDDNGYIIVANQQLHFDFLSKAILHYQYLDPETPIACDKDKYVFGKADTIENVLWPVKQFQRICDEQKKIGKSQISSKVYFI